jgi:AcrR family transcriptional regulator
MSDMETKNRILDQALEQFLQFGFSKVTMNEIADALGMSKKTLYQYFVSKEELLMAMMERLHQEIIAKIDALVDDGSLSLIDKWRAILETVAVHHERLTPHFLLDLQKHVPQADRCSKEFRNERLRGMIEKLIRQGTQEGVLRTDVNLILIPHIFTGAIESIVKPGTLEALRMTIPDVHNQIASILLEGILTDESRQILAARVRNPLPPQGTN